MSKAFHQFKTADGRIAFQHEITGRSFDNHGFTLKCCNKCGGVGRLAGYEHVENAQCFRCMGKGHYYTDKVSRARHAMFEWAKAEATAAKQEGREPTRPDFKHFWALAGNKVEDDVAAQLGA